MDISARLEKLGEKIRAAVFETQVELSKIALEDCNKFCKADTGETLVSSYKASDFAKGKLIWASKHARHAYYLGEADRSKNPMASRLWAHKAAALFNEKWLREAKRKFISAMSGGKQQ